MPLQIPVTQTGLEASIQQAMKNAGRNAQINLGTNSRQINALAQPLGRITGQADEFTKSMEAANARVFAFGASVGIINGVSKAFGALVKNTIEVEKSLVEINTVLNASGDSLQKFGNKLFDVAKTTGQTFDVVAKGALELARQGLSTEETLKRINDALILSRLSGLDAQQSVEGLTAAFNSFKETGITTSQILNKLVVVSQKYSVSERDLIEGLKRSASVADQAGVSFDELVGIITTVQERTARGGAVIGNAFKTIFARIQDTGALQDLANLGIQVTDLEGKVLPATRILQNLGAEFNNLSQLEQADIAKKLGGVYQLSNLLAAVKDLSSEQSKYNDIVKLSAGATNEAYQKNAALNETLAALINKVSVSAQQLGATLGAIGITDNLKQLLDFFNKILEGIQGILGEESMLGDMFRGLAKGIGNVLAGPGLALFGAIIAKLSKDLISFGVESLKSFFKIGQSAKEIASVEKSIAAALGSNLTLQKQLFALEGNRAAQIKLMTDAIVQQEAVMRRMASTAGSLAGPLYQQGVRSSGGQGLRVPKAAGGYMPAVSQESRDISRGVGGAKAGDKPVVIPNFAFGGGKKGTMVAHTGEYIVPNFAAGGSAIFNRDMVRSMGLPAGAQKIGAAGGFIPNFAKLPVTTREFAREQYELGNYEKRGKSYYFNDGTSRSEAQMKDVLNVQKSNNIDVASLLGNRLPTILTPTGASGISAEYIKTNALGDGRNLKFQFKSFGLQANGKQSVKQDFEKRFSDEAIEKIATNTALSYARKIVSSLDSDLPVDPKTIKEVDNVKGFISSVKGAFGGIFDAAVSTGIRVVSRDNSKSLEGIGGDFDINAKGDARDNIIKLFGSNSLSSDGLADFKINANKYAAKSMANKVLSSPIFVNALKAGALNKASNQIAVKKASKGYIPNFAKYIYDSDRIPADKGATLKAILASSAKKNLIIGPAGSGKSTLAGKLGKFLTGASDVANASEIDILSGAARAKGGGLSKNLEALIASVNASGGKVSYLYAKNLDILSRRIGRTSASDGDLRSKKQLIGTRYAPLNQFDFMGAVKSRSRNFNMVSGAGGYIPNFAVDLTKSQDYIENQRKRNFKAGTYRKATGTIGSLFKSLPEKFFADGVLGDGAQGLETNGIFNLIKQNALYGASFAGPKAVKFVTEAEKYGLKVEKSLKDKLAKLVVKGASKIKGYSGGFLPNFADPLKEAISREMSAGVPASQIYVDQNSSLKNSMNPMGLMVANRRDEPAGGMQGINRARKEGANPMMYGAAGGFVPNYANTGPGTMINSVNTSTGVSRTPTGTTTSSADVEKPKRDFLGTIFAVQAGLSLLTGATEGATSAFGKYTNIISGGIGTATSILFASQGLASALPKFAGFLGPAGIAVAGVTAAFQIGKGVFLELSGANKRAADAGKTLATAAEKAALRLDELGGSGKQDVERTVEDIIQKLNIQSNESEMPKLKEAISAALLGTSRTDVENVLKANLEKQNVSVQTGTTAFGTATFGTESSLGGKITNAVNKLADLSVTGQGAVLTKNFLPLATKAQSPEELKNLISTELGKNLKDFKLSDGLIKEIFDPEALLKAEDQLKQLQASSDPNKINLLTKEGKPEEAAELTKLLKESNVSYATALELINEINKAREQQAGVEAEASATAKTTSSKQLEQTIRDIQIESNLRKKLFQQTNKANNAQIAADSDIANIKSDITLSELQRNKLIGRRQFQLEKDLALLENQRSEMTEIATLAKQISESSLIGIGDKVGATEQAKTAIKALSEGSINETTKVADVPQMLKDLGVIDFGLIQNEAVLQDILTAALKVKDAAAKTKEEFNQQNNFKEKGLSLAEAEAKVNENNSRVFEKMQSAMSAMADDRSILARRLGYQSQLIDAEKNVKLAQFEKSSLGMSSSEKIAGQRAIERETFNKQLEINTRKSVVEIEADFIRNSKVQENIIALQDNNTALKENTNALLQVKVNGPTPNELTPLGKAFQEGVPAKNNFYNKNDLNYIAENGANVSQLNPQLAANLEKFAKDFYDKFKEELQISGPRSAFRTIQESADIRATAIKEKGMAYALKYTATPGRSQHNFGNAVDFSESQINKAVSSGMNLQSYGLTRPMSWEDWHIELAGARGKGVSGVNTNQAPFTAAPLNIKTLSPEDQMKKGRELASLETAKEINEAAQKYTNELGLQGDASLAVAENIKNFALRIKEVGEEKATAEKLEQMSQSAQDMRDAIKSIAELEKGGLETQLKDLKESPITFSEGMENGFLSMQVKQAQFAYNLGKEIPEMFSQNMSDAIMSAVTGTETLKDALLGAANSFLTELNKKLMSNLVDQATSSLGNFGMSLFQNKASGGMITGGSGTKDDVPAMLMGGEYVVKKKAVQKYGPDFLSAINNGTLGGYAKGGSVKKPTQTGEGGYFLPGLYGDESISGSDALMSFATQNYTSGARDIISSGSNFASIDLEQESIRLSQRGRTNSPLFAATQSAKEQALGMVFEQVSREEAYKKAIEEAKKQEKARQKAIRKQLLISSAMAIGSAVAGPLLGAASSGFKAAFGAAKSAGATNLSAFGSGIKGMVTGGQLPGITQNVGGLNNLFKGVGQGLTGNFAEAGNLMKLSQIGNMDQFNALYMKNAFANNGKGTPFLDFAQGIGYIPKAINPYSNMGVGLNGGNDFNWFQKVFAPAGSALNNINNSRQQRRATGGTIPETSGIDTVPTMLSGGEFIMNRAAAQNIGAGNLQTLNAGASSLPTEEKTEELNDKLISKLDELIQANSSKSSVGEININVDGSGKSNESSSGGQAGTANQQLARNIRDMVVKVIQDEQRLGGLLR